MYYNTGMLGCMNINNKLQLFHSWCTQTEGNLNNGSYGYTQDSLALESCVSFRGGLPLECCLTLTPLKPDVWESLLASIPDRPFVDFLLRGL